MSRFDHPSYNRPVSESPPSWDYLPEPPFLVVWHNLDSPGGAEPKPVHTRSLLKAITNFFEVGYPPKRGWMGVIQDADARAVLAWSCTRENLDKHGPDGYIFGVDATFRYMIEREIPNFVDSQIWADVARERANK